MKPLRITGHPDKVRHGEELVLELISDKSPEVSTSIIRQKCQPITRVYVRSSLSPPPPPLYLLLPPFPPRVLFIIIIIINVMLTLFKVFLFNMCVLFMVFIFLILCFLGSPLRLLHCYMIFFNFSGNLC